MAPSVETTTGCGQVTAPVPPAQLKVTVTSELFQPAALGAGPGAAEILKRVAVKVTGIAMAAWLPATSMACTMIVFDPAASVTPQDKLPCASVAGDPLQVTVAIPERVSAIVPVTIICGLVTIAPEVGEPIATAGGVLSIFSVTEAVAVPPAPSVAVREITCVPSAETVTG